MLHFQSKHESKFSEKLFKGVVHFKFKSCPCVFSFVENKLKRFMKAFQGSSPYNVLKQGAVVKGQNFSLTHGMSELS